MRQIVAIGVLGVVTAIIAAHSDSARASAPPTSIELTQLAKPFLPKLRRSGVPVLLPTRLPLASHYPRLYASGQGKRGSFDLGVDAARHCGGANACFVASFAGERASALPGRANVRLRGGVPALFHPVSCGASCAPASLSFRYRAVLYSWQIKDLRGEPRATMVALANEAIASGGR